MQTSLFAVALITLGASACAPAPPATRAATPEASLSDWAPVRQELEALFDVDQVERKRAFEVMTREGRPDHPVSEARNKAIWAKVGELDAANQASLARIVASRGWPPRSAVGPKAALTAFLILQHAPLATQKEYAPAFRASVARREADPSHLALLEDRMRVGESRPQIYGSQIRIEGGGVTLEPVEDPAHLDERRASVELDPICAYLGGFASEGPILWPPCAGRDDAGAHSAAVPPHSPPTDAR